MYKIDKSLVQKRFSKSVDTYNQHAKTQSIITKKLSQLLAQQKINEFNKVLELGCGTGRLTEENFNNFKIDNYTCNDLVPEYDKFLQDLSKKHQKNIDFIPHDLEDTSVLGSGYDLICSASTFQWIVDLDKLFDSFESMLNPNGYFAFATFGPLNLIEIRKINDRGLYYTPFEKLQSIVEERFELIHISEEILPLYFDEPIDVLKHIKLTGVNAVIETKFNKTDLIDFIRKYNYEYRDSLGVKLSYHPIYVIAKKK